MKKTITAILLIALLISVCAFAFAAEQSISAETLSEDFLFYPDQNGIWIINDGQILYAADASLENARVIAARQAEHISAYAGTLYFTENRGADAYLNALSLDGSAREWALADSGEIIRILATEDDVFLLVHDDTRADADQADAYTLLRFDLESGRTADSAIAENVIDAAPAGRDGVLLLQYSAAAHCMQAAILKSSGVIECLLDDLQDTYYFIAADAAVDTIYLAGINHIDQIDLATRERRSVSIGSQQGALSGLVIRNDKIYTYDSNQNCILIADCAEPAQQSAFSIVNLGIAVDPRFVYAQAQMLEQYPDLQVQQADIPYERLNLDLMRGAEGLDLICMDTDEYDLYVQRGILLPVDDLAGALADESQASISLLPLMRDGQLYALPVSMEIRAFGLNDYFDTLGMQWTADETLTWAELYRRAREAGIGGRGDACLFTANLEYPFPIMDGYMSNMAFLHDGKISFDTPEFRETMELYRQMVQEGMIASETDFHGSAAMTYYPFWTFTSDASRYRMVPIIDENLHRQPVIMAVLGIPSFSQHTEEARAYLRAYGTAECQLQQYYGVLGEMFLRNADDYSAEVWAAEYDDYSDALRLKTQAEWCGRIYHHDLAVYMQGGLMRDYLNGTIQIDQLIFALDSKMDMLQSE